MHPISARSIFTDSNNSGISVDNIGRIEKKRETFFYRVSTREFLPLLFPFVSRILGLFDSIRERERERKRNRIWRRPRGESFLSRRILNRQRNLVPGSWRPKNWIGRVSGEGCGRRTQPPWRSNVFSLPLILILIKTREIGSKFRGKCYVDSYQADCRGWLLSRDRPRLGLSLNVGERLAGVAENETVRGTCAGRVLDPRGWQHWLWRP